MTPSQQTNSEINAHAQQASDNETRPLKDDRGERNERPTAQFKHDIPTRNAHAATARLTGALEIP